jgi:hypothetical protein
MKVITQVPKQGKIESYVNKPVVDSFDSFDRQGKVIGVVRSAVEVSNSYELTIDLWGKYTQFSREFMDGELSAIGFQNK